jgi:hypothetical protein
VNVATVVCFPQHAFKPRQRLPIGNGCCPAKCRTGGLAPRARVLRRDVSPGVVVGALRAATRHRPRSIYEVDLPRDGRVEPAAGSPARAEHPLRIGQKRRMKALRLAIDACRGILRTVDGTTHWAEARDTRSVNAKRPQLTDSRFALSAQLRLGRSWSTGRTQRSTRVDEERWSIGAEPTDRSDLTGALDRAAHARGVGAIRSAQVGKREWVGGLSLTQACRRHRLAAPRPSKPTPRSAIDAGSGIFPLPPVVDTRWRVISE